jgi:hypothetical protein
VSIETMVTLVLAAAIFVTALLLLGILTVATRLAMFVLRPAARGGYGLSRRYAPVAAAGLVAFWRRTSPAIQLVGERLGAQGLESTERAGAVAASWGRRLGAHARVWGRRAMSRAGVWAYRFATYAARWGRSSAAGARSLGKRSAAGAATLGDRSAEGMTRYVVPAVRSLFTDDEDLGLDPTSSARRHRTRHS